MLLLQLWDAVERLCLHLLLQGSATPCGVLCWAVLWTQLPKFHSHCCISCTACCCCCCAHPPLHPPPANLLLRYVLLPPPCLHIWGGGVAQWQTVRLHSGRSWVCLPPPLPGRSGTPALCGGVAAPTWSHYQVCQASAKLVLGPQYLGRIARAHAKHTSAFGAGMYGTAYR